MAKNMTATEQAEYDRESAAIRDNMKKPEAKQRHKFKPAKFTFGNGHPRCLVCGDEETVGGYCNSSDVSKADEPLRPLWGSPGGKSRYAKRLAALLPEHETYVEPFVGSAAVFFAKEPSKNEIIGDADREIAMAFRALKSIMDDDVERLKSKKWIGDKATYDGLRKNDHVSGPVDSLYRFLYLSRCGFGGKRYGGFNPVRSGNKLRAADRVPAVRDRLRGVKVVSGDYETIARKCDGPTTVFYFDRPYAGFDVSIGEKGFDEKRFFEFLKSIKGRFVLTYGTKGDLPDKLKAHENFRTHMIDLSRAGHFVRAPGSNVSVRLKTMIVTNFDVNKDEIAALRKADEDIAFVATLTKETVDEMDDAALKDSAERLADVWDRKFVGSDEDPDGLNREEVLLAALGVLGTAHRRGVEMGERYLFNAAAEWATLQKDTDLAPVHPGSEGEHEPLVLGDVLAPIKPSMLIRDAVSYVGSLPQWSETRGDVDVLNKIPDGDALRHIANFRVGRQYEPEISGRLKFMDEDEYLANRDGVDHGRLSFHDDELGGPFTTHVPGYDLWLVPKTYDVVPREGAEFTRVEMAADIAKQANEYRKYPPTKNKPVRSAVQAHFRGRSVGYDWRIASLAGKDVIGWSIDAQKPKVIKEPVQTLQEARRYTAGVGLEGNRYFKPLTGPGGIGVRAHQKPLEPREWMEIDTRVVDPGGIGATKEHHGVFIAIDRPMVELGILEPYFHEYFATRGSWFNGTALLRQLVGRGGEAAEEEAGRVTRRGEAYWKFSFAVKPLPSVLRRRAVREGKMPPPGIAAIPRDLMALVPAEYRYWEKRGASAKQARDALVSSKFFTEDNIRVVGGKYVRVSEKQVFYSVPSQTEKAGAVDGKYRFVWQYWKRRAETVREAPTREMWHLLVQAGGKKYGWTFFQDPLTSKRASGTSGSPSAADWKREGEIEPGTTGGLINNERKATPSWAEVREAGKAQVLTEAGPEKNSLLVRLETKDQPVMLYLRPEEKGARTWISEIRSAKSVEFDALPDSALVSFAKHGPEIAECPGCGELEFDRIDEVGKCLKCGVSAFVDPIARHAWELQMSGADLGAVPVVVAEAVPAPENTTEEPSPPVDGDGNGTLPIVRVPIGKGDEFKGYFFDIVIKPNDGKDGPAEPDTQKDVYNSAEIDYAMRWNAEHAETDKINHDPSIPATGDHAFVIVQNFLAPVDYWLGPHGETRAEPNDWRESVIDPPGDGYRFVPKGSWLREGKATGKKLYDALLKGEITAWSIEGSAVKTPEYIEIKAAVAAA